MKIQVTLAIASLLVASPLVNARGETCSLGQMASLDMTMLSDGRFAVPVSINGTSHLFMVDTAGVFSKISDSAVQELGLKKVSMNGKSYGVAGGYAVFSVKTDSFKLGLNEAKDFHFVVDRPRDADTKFDGILAADMLTLFDVEIDMAHKKMNLFSQDHCPGKVVYWTRDAYAELPFHLSGNLMSGNRDNHIDVTMKLDGHDVSTNVDTGSFQTWIRMKPAKRTFGLDESSPGMERLSAAGDIPVYRGHFNSLTIGGLAVKDPDIEIIADKMEDAFRMDHSEKSRDDPVYGADFSVEDLYIGMSTLSKLRVYIAYKERKLYATAADAR